MVTRDNMSQPLFTIATITYNSGEWTRQAIESVLASTFTDFELIISDDCSTDNTWEIIQEYKDERIVRWRNEKNIGEYPNRNKVLENARGKYILFIDGDDMLYKDSLQRYSWYLTDYPNVRAIWGVGYDWIGNVRFPVLLSSETIIKMSYLNNSLILFVGFPESLFQVEALKKIGGIDTRFDIGDTYLKKKFACYYDVLAIPIGMAFWRVHANQASKVKTSKYAGFIQNYQIDSEILKADYFPLSGLNLNSARKKFKQRTVKLLVSKTIFKGKVADFFMLRRKLSIPLSDFRNLL